MSRYLQALRDVNAMKSLLQAAALTDLEQKLLKATNAAGKGANLTDLARRPEFRGVHFGKIMSAAESLKKKKKVVFDGNFIASIDFSTVGPSLGASTVKAAKDIGDPKKDKKRKGEINDLVKRATTLAETMPGEGFSEVKDAVTTVTGLADLINRMDMAALRLKAAPAASSEAVEAQKLIDALRMSADTMLPPLAATMETLETLTQVAAELESQFAAQSAQVKALDEKLKREKARLAAAASAVQNAVKLA